MIEGNIWDFVEEAIFDDDEDFISYRRFEHSIINQRLVGVKKNTLLTS